MADIKALKSYLVSLGFKVNTPQLQAFNNTIKTATSLVEESSNKWIKGFAGAYGVAMSTFAAIGTAAVMAADKVAMTDQKYRIWGEHMFMDVQHARALNMVTEALGATIGEIAHDPELRKRAEDLFALQRQMTEQLGPNYEDTMERIRDVRFEFTKLKMEGEYFLMNVVAKVFQALGGESFIDRLKALNDYIVAHIPVWSDMISRYIVPILKDVWAVMVSVWDIFKEFAKEFTNLIGLLSGDSTLEGTVFNFEKFAKAVQTTVHWVAILLEGIDWLIEHLLPLAGTITGALIGGAVGGPAGMAIGAAAGGAVDLARYSFSKTGSDTEQQPFNNMTVGDARTLARKVVPAVVPQAKVNSDVVAAATEAAQRLNTTPQLVLAQWMQETGDFKNRGALDLHNYAGINIPGGHGRDYRTFGSNEDFVNYYVRLIQNRYPGVVGAQSVEQFATALQRGKIGPWFVDKNSTPQQDLAIYERGMHSAIRRQVNINQITINQQPGQSAHDMVNKIKDEIAKDQGDQMSMQLAQLRGY